MHIHVKLNILLFLVLCYLMIAPGERSAAAAPAARIGRVTYGTLEQAVRAVKNGQTITLLRNVRTAKTLTVNQKKRFVLDMDRKRYTCTAKKGRAAVNLVNGWMTIKNGRMKAAKINLFRVGTRARLTIEKGRYQGMVANEGSLTVKSGMFAAVSQKKWLFDNKGTLTIKDGLYKAYGNVVLNEKGGKVAISGGSFTNTCAKNYPILYNRSGRRGKFIISGGEFRADGKKEVLYNKSGKCFIRGGTFETKNAQNKTGKYPAISNGPDGILYLSKGTLSNEGHVVVGNSGTLTVSGGVLMGNPKYALLSNRGRAKIKGGIFKSFDGTAGYSIYNWPDAELEITVSDYYRCFGGRIMEGDHLIWSPTLGTTKKDAA